MYITLVTATYLKKFEYYNQYTGYSILGAYKKYELAEEKAIQAINRELKEDPGLREHYGFPGEDYFCEIEHEYVIVRIELKLVDVGAECNRIFCDD